MQLFRKLKKLFFLFKLKKILKNKNNFKNKNKNKKKKSKSSLNNIKNKIKS
jgi:hypothetical protein